jgi:hypothetical protein
MERVRSWSWSWSGNELRLNLVVSRWCSGSRGGGCHNASSWCAIQSH